VSKKKRVEACGVWEKWTVTEKEKMKKKKVQREKKKKGNIQ